MIPTSLIGDVLAYYHKGFGMHFSAFKMMAMIKENLFWHSISKDVKAYTRACVHCRKLQKKPNLLKYGLLSTHKASEPFEIVFCDILNKSRSKSGNTALFVYIDSFSRFLMTVPLKKITALDTKRALQICIQNSMIPRRLVTDQGRNLDNSIIRNFAARLGFPIT